MSNQLTDEEAIFKAACQIAPPEARTEYLNQVCGDNPALFARMAALLRVYEQEPCFLESPPPGIGEAGVGVSQEAPVLTEGPGTHSGLYKLLQQISSRSHPPRQLGDFRIVREIGRGGMGVVYEAEQQSLERRVALKVMPQSMLTNDKLARRFEREARAAGKLHHTNIVPVFGVGQDSGLHYYVMQYIDGRGLDEVLEELRRLRDSNDRKPSDRTSSLRKDATLWCDETCDDNASPYCCDASLRDAAWSLISGEHAEAGSAERWRTMGQPDSSGGGKPSDRTMFEENAKGSGRARLPGSSDSPSLASSRTVFWLSVARIGVQAAQALQYAHEQAIIHRDIKPANLLLDTHGTVWVTDFGLAKATDQQNLTHPGDVLGTLRYMAPEQFEGRGDARADIYSLGLTLYELLILKPAFGEQDRSTLVRHVTTGTPERLRVLDSQIPRDLETIVHKAIDREQSHRYQTAAELAEDLQRFAHGEPIRARPLAAWERVWKWSRRNPVLAGLSAAVLLLLLTVTGVSVVSARVYLGQRNVLSEALGQLEETTDRLRLERDRALRAEGAERTKRAEALFDKTQKGRWSGQVGRHFEGLAAIAEAAQIVRTLNISSAAANARLMALRGEAIACMGLADFRVIEHHAIEPNEQQQMHTESGLRAFRSDDHTITLDVAARATGKLVLDVPGADIEQLAISPDGQRIAATYGGVESGICLWQVTGQQLLRRQVLPVAPDLIRFSRDSLRLCTADPDGTVRLFDLQTDQLPTVLAGLERPVDLTFSPDDRTLAMVNKGPEVLILDASERRRAGRLITSLKASCIDWSPDGSYLALGGSDGRLQVIDAQSGKLHAMMTGSKHTLDRVRFHPGGDYLFTAGWDGTTRLWHIATQQEVLRAPGRFLGFDRTGNHLSYVNNVEIGIWEVDLAEACQFIAGHDPSTTVLGSTFHPDGKLLATYGYDGVRLWDLTTVKEVGFLDVGPSEGAVFATQGGRLFTSSRRRGLVEWPVQQLVSDGATQIQIGPARRLATLRPPRNIKISASGNKLAYTISEKGDAAILDLGTEQTVAVRRSGDLAEIAISPDGKWLAGTPQHTSGIVIWDTLSGIVVQELPTNGWAQASFSPDGRWLVTSDLGEIRFWQTTDWTTTHAVPLPGTGCLAFSPDGRVVATAKITATDGPNAVLLLETESGRLLARLENTPAPIQIERLMSFSPDGRFLVVPHYRDALYCVWDLVRIRQQLAEMGLDWNLPPLGESEATKSRLPPVRIDWGELTRVENPAKQQPVTPDA